MPQDCSHSFFFRNLAEITPEFQSTILSCILEEIDLVTSLKFVSEISPIIRIDIFSKNLYRDYFEFLLPFKKFFLNLLQEFLPDFCQSFIQICNCNLFSYFLQYLPVSVGYLPIITTIHTQRFIFHSYFRCSEEFLYNSLRNCGRTPG